MKAGRNQLILKEFYTKDYDNDIQEIRNEVNTFASKFDFYDEQ